MYLLYQPVNFIFNCDYLYVLIYAYWFQRERKGGREREREKHQSVASHWSPDQGLTPQPRHVPWLGIKPVALQLIEGRDFYLLLQHIYIYILMYLRNFDASNRTPNSSGLSHRHWLDRPASICLSLFLQENEDIKNTRPPILCWHPQTVPSFLLLFVASWDRWLLQLQSHGRGWEQNLSQKLPADPLTSHGPEMGNMELLTAGEAGKLALSIMVTS